jgi:type IV secretory pathway component VirB8
MRRCRTKLQAVIWIISLSTLLMPSYCTALSVLTPITRLDPSYLLFDKGGGHAFRGLTRTRGCLRS